MSTIKQLETDYHNFKTICQKCGKTGIIDTHKLIDEWKFILRRDCGRRGKTWCEPVLDYFICKECMGLEE